MKKTKFTLFFVVAFLASPLNKIFAQCNSNNNIGGNVFHDFNADGIKGTYETGVANVTITAYNNSGVAGTANTDSNGDYVLSISDGTDIRLEFSNLPANYESGYAGTGSKSAISFWTSPSCDADFSVSYPEDYCENTPRLATACYVNGDPLAGGTAATPDAYVGFGYDKSGNGADYSNNPPTTGSGGMPSALANASQIGAVWGNAWDKRSEDIFTSAVLKRHSGTGTLGLSGIYRIHYPDGGSASVSEYIELNACGSVDVGSVSRPDLPANKNTESDDTEAYQNIGKKGLGGIDISDDGTALWTINLNTKELIEIKIRNTTTSSLITHADASSPDCSVISTYNIPEPCSPIGDTRPFAVKFYRDKVYVGLVCSGETNDATPSAYVYEFNPSGAGTFTQVLTFSLGYAKGCAQDAVGCTWNAWDNTYQYESDLNGEITYPQPILSDLEFDIDGSLIIGFLDRFGMQTGTNNNWEVAGTTELFSGNSGGDIRYAYNDNGTFVIESNGDVKKQNGTIVRNGCNNSVADNIEGIEFYCGDIWKTGSLHNETALGGLAFLMGSGNIVTSAFDPTDKAFAGGVKWLSNQSGAAQKGYAIYYNASNPEDGFGKAVGVGDVEVLCSTAPIQVGNRIWADYNGNGIQDAGEDGISGITVNLYNSAGTKIADTQTDTDGHYYFDMSDGLDYTNTFTIALDDAQYDETNGLASFNTGAITYEGITNADQGASSNQNMIDSDANIGGSGISALENNGLPYVEFTTGTYGQNQHKYDIGILADNGLAEPFLHTCDEGIRVDMITDGMYGQPSKIFNIATLVDDTDFNDDYITKLELTAYFKGTSGYPATVDFTVNGVTQTANATQDAGTKGATYYRTVFSFGTPTTVTTFTTTPSSGTAIRSVVAYVFSEPPAFQGAFAGELGVITSLYYNSGTINDLIPDGNNDDCVMEIFSIPESATDRDVTLQFAFSEFTDDDRNSYVKLTPVGAPGYTPVEAYFNVQNAGDEAAIGTAIMSNVPAGVTEIEVLVCSRQVNPNGKGGQSAVYAGVFIDASETCLSTCPTNLDPLVQPTCGEDNGEISVDASTGPDGDYTYTLTPSVGTPIVVNTTDKTQAFSNLAAGDYTLLVEGPFSCEDEFDITLTNNNTGCSGCDLAITGITNSSCSDGTVSIDVNIAWSDAPVGENIEVKVGSMIQTINVTSGATSPSTVQFTVPGNGAASNIITAQFENGTCYDSDGATYTAPCCPNGCEEVTINKK